MLEPTPPAAVGAALDSQEPPETTFRTTWFQYYASTANPNHTRPASIAEIGNHRPANHEYDLEDFFGAVSAGNHPAVSFLKAQAYEDGHAGYSNPLDEQNFLVRVINFLQTQPGWASTAVVIMYDHSDGWYDHQIGPIVNQSQGPADALTAGFEQARPYCDATPNLGKQKTAGIEKTAHC